MSKIKSAWEIALEKTEDIKIDEKKLAYDEAVKKARTIAGKYVNNDEDAGEDVQKELSSISDKVAMKEGVRMTIVQNLNLPSEEVLTDRFERLEKLASIITNNNEEVSALLSQITTFLKQYPLHKKQLIDQLKEQYAPALEQKAAQLREKYGQSVTLSAENDPEFLKIADSQLERLSKQYTESLDEAKTQLNELLK